MNIESKLKEALIKDFNALYTKEFTTTWRVEQLIRETEIKIMKLDNVVNILKLEMKPTTFQEILQRDLGKG